VEVFEEVRRVLRNDGTLWVNMGDCYANDGKWGGRSSGKHAEGLHGASSIGRGKRTTGLKPKDLCGMPWRLAFALQGAGWYLRSDCIWDKVNPMPESVRDRPTKAHEYIFLFSRAERYYYNAEAIREPDNGSDHPRNVLHRPEPSGGIAHPNSGIRRAEGRNGAGRNLRTVWRFTTQPYPEAHFATFPPELAERCILAGSRPGDAILDPFGGAGTTAMVALRLGRPATTIELNPAYVEMAERRIRGDAPLLNETTRRVPEATVDAH
jgi:DNA modification methylase